MHESSLVTSGFPKRFSSCFAYSRCLNRDLFVAHPSDIGVPWYMSQIIDDRARNLGRWIVHDVLHEGVPNLFAVHVPAEQDVHPEREFVWVRRPEKRKGLFERNISGHNTPQKAFRSALILALLLSTTSICCKSKSFV